MSITQITFKIQCSFRTSFPNYSQDNFSKTPKAGHIMHKQVSCSHAKNRNSLQSLKPYTVESLEFMVAQFSWNSWVPLILEFTFQRNNKLNFY